MHGLRWSNKAKNVSSAFWVLSTQAVTAWPAPDSSTVLASGPNNVPATGKTTMFHLELKPYLAAAAPELGKSDFVRIFTLGANGKTVSQRLIPTGGRSGLQTRTAMTESVSLCVRMKS